ncbi:LysR family transcriptional regulator [Paracandidimonas soli]|uniref:LysR family transcriptional regulator n=1 Tax=Paracandidimonas soli TaxID=1917182 RepID=A0A4R3VDC7_9BURK|nr:LysR family transcriptional regulator [Paracandidimonas soli]TCV00705.1 LysR family transcriptional regulator [Paracandidimonas soli]
MTLKQLEAFYWAATCDSFSIAASRLHLSQSSLSKRIVELEESLGKPLFDRTLRRSQLTVEGRALLPHARQLLAHAEQVASMIKAEENLRGVCRFGVGEIAASSWLPRFVSHVKQQFPALSLEPYVELGQNLEAKLIAGEVDFAMIAMQSVHSQLSSQRLVQVEFVWAAASAITSDGDYAEDLLKDFPIISLDKSAGTRRILDCWLKDQQRKHLPIITSNNLSTMAGLAAAGLGISYFPKGWLQPLIKKGILRVLPSRTPLQGLDYYFHWRTDDIRPYISKLRDLMASDADYTTSLLQL